eukprot:4427561-Pleurochrysis_carterae.AAC.2
MDVLRLVRGKADLRARANEEEPSSNHAPEAVLHVQGTHSRERSMRTRTRAHAHRQMREHAHYD